MNSGPSDLMNIEMTEITSMEDALQQVHRQGSDLREREEQVLREAELTKWKTVEIFKVYVYFGRKGYCSINRSWLTFCKTSR